MNEQMIEKIKESLREDIPSIDVSSYYLFEDELSTGKFIAKENGVISGLDVLVETFKIIDPETKIELIKHNGETVQCGDILATVTGRTKSILQSERVGLNFLQRMSGIATMTRKFVDQTEGFDTLILDTRKTTPSLRFFEKRAVVDGGGTNHRMNLSEMVMLKDNHLKAANSIVEACAFIRSKVGKNMKIEVEVETIEKFKEALNSEANIIMLDNMSNELMKECVELNQHKKVLEASGNMTVDRIKSVCETGVDTISVGALTHSYKSLDISLKF
ncbi:MAG: carboxylating nicotinate-nucleotide diphosphorylase [Tenericutes bacterium]|nr:carboxylating nicotinate-nucleotide diphosphorylase [Mycoplasmatota bacterium]